MRSRISTRLTLFAVAAMVLAAPARAQVTPDVQAKILEDPSYKAFDDKRNAIIHSGAKGEARFRALRSLQESNAAVIRKAFGAAGFPDLLSNRVRVLPHGAFSVPFTMDGDTRVYTPPFSHRVANNGYADANGTVVAQADTFDAAIANVTFRSYAGVSVTVPPGAVGMVVSADVDVHADLYTDAKHTGASARATVMAEAKGSLPEDGFWDVLLIQEDAPALTLTTWASYPPGMTHVSTTVVPVTPGQTAYASGGVTAWVNNGYSSDAHAGAVGVVRRIGVKFIYPPASTPTPIPAFAATAAPKVNAGVSNAFLAGPADIALFALPSGPGWPTELAVKNLGGKTSESTIVRAKVVLTQGNIDVVAQNCKPRFVDFDEAVPALAPGKSVSIGLLTKIGPSALAAWVARNKPVPVGGRPVKTPTPNPVQTFVVCRYTLTASLGQNQNQGDPNSKNNTLTRDIVENVPLK